MDRYGLRRIAAAASAVALTALLPVPASAATVPDGYFPRTQTWDCKKLGTFEVAYFSDDDSSPVVYLGDADDAVAVTPVHGWSQFTLDGVTEDRMVFKSPMAKPKGYKIDKCVISAAGIEEGVAVSLAGVAFVVTADWVTRP